ncbi:TonB-dependent receptor domain-containing protein [Pedobacter nototheniae]|uniref:TonB-dependent receptor domain-containing protein n=1 Tax=Pedobacter nototheniae TaxID=2488994 RepID=UPI00292D3124|nr:TonB-dependent receptor [Pedobacter nototheniae]
MKIGFYAHIKEYIINLNCRPLVAILLLGIFTFSSTLAAGLIQNLKKNGLSLKLTAVSIPEALSALEHKAGYAINFNKSIFSESQKITIDVREMSIDQILKKILAGTHVAYKFADQQTILLYKLPDPVKPGKISGKVFDEKGETLPGASIKVIETGKATQTAIDGSYSLSIDPGTYTLEISYVSFLTYRISGVVVKADKNTPLDVSLKPDSKGLKEVLITANYKKASVEGLLSRQKNAAEISNGISADQISRTPDKNIGESLKRISGVNTVDNKFVIVRGIGERYNSAQLDGVLLPSTEAQTRNFSFDLIPSNLVDNIVVSKTVTADMNTSFGGGLVQINTKDIPTENFMSFTAGTSYNDQSTGKDFLSHKRGKYDYFGFDDGRRDFPVDLQQTDRGTAPNNVLTDAEFQKKVDDQSKKFTNDNFTIYKYKTAPSQNYQFTIGRLIKLDTVKQNKLGFTGSLTYRNTQNINQFDNVRRSDWYYNFNNYGAKYIFNTTLGALLNVGLQLGQNRFSFRNTYTHLYNNELVRTTGYDNNDGSSFINAGIPPSRVQEVDDPTFTDLLQNKLSGQHQVGKVKLEWNAARTSIDRKEKDIGIATNIPKLVGGQYLYFYDTTPFIQGNILPTSRHNYSNSERHYSWSLDASTPFNVAGIRNTVKAGYFGINKKGKFDWQIAALASSPTLADSLRYIPISEMANPANFGVNGYNYAINAYYLNGYEGNSNTHAGYVMFDDRLSEKIRLVWGLRAEYYKYNEIRNDLNTNGKSEFVLPVEKKWQWLPSANLTYSPTSQINLRAAISSTVIRPELLDNSQFFRFDPNLGAMFGNQGLTSTRINSYDVKAEWFPGLGQIISVGGFYKKFDKPTELTFILVNGNVNYYIKNADEAKVYGLEFELRKNLGFITDNPILTNIAIYGNLTLQKSNVVGTYQVNNPDPKLPPISVPIKQKRPMYGQSPYLINLGLQYTGDRLGMNIAYNKSGYKTYIVSSLFDQIEYEQPREQIDAQLSYKFLNKRFEIKVNAANLLNKASTFYINNASYESKPDRDVNDLSDIGIRLKTGFSDRYDEGDQIRYRQKFGRTYSTSITYNF